MITRISSIEELKQLFVEILINKTDKVTKVSNESVVNGVAYGAAKTAQKALKDIGLVETHLFPDYAFGSHLDNVADKLGISPRFDATKSSMYVRVVGNSGTTYAAATHKFSGSGVTFDLLEDVTIGPNGFAYAKVRSQNEGKKTNVDPLTVTTVDPVPSGHLFCINEYRASGGRDAEEDRDFRIRIKEGANIAATGTTLSKINQVFQKINSDVFKVFFQGINTLNQPILAVATTNGGDLTTPELEELESRATEYLSIIDLPVTGGSVGLEVKNIEYQPIDVSFRVDLKSGAVADEVRKRVQVAMSKYLDWRYWEAGKKVEWDDLLQIVKDDPEVKYVPDTEFSPNADVQIDITKLPRMRGFIMMDLDGSILSSVTGTLNPVYYPSDPDLFFQTTVTSSI